jgi:hypothetical protein
VIWENGKKCLGGKYDISLFSFPRQSGRAKQNSNLQGLVIKTHRGRRKGERRGWKENRVMDGYSAALRFSTQSKGNGEEEKYR